MSDTKTCEFEVEVYPHEGCRGFGPPDTIRCFKPATKLVQFVEGDNVLPYLACAEHAIDLGSDCGAREPLHDGARLIYFTHYGNVEVTPWDGRPLHYDHGPDESTNE